jgi:hypothetical protein
MDVHSKHRGVGTVLGVKVSTGRMAKVPLTI